MPRLTVDGFSSAALAVILIALFNAAVRPVVLALAAPVSLVLVGVLVLVLQIVSFVIIAQWSPGVHVDGFGTALIASFVYAIVNTILTALLGVDRGGSYYGLLVQRLLVQRSTGPHRQAGPGHHPDRRSRPPDPGRPDARRLGQHDGRHGPRRQPQAVALGGDPAVDDVRQPGRHPPRQQRRHPRVPLVRARPPAPDGLEQPGRRDADRVAHLERRGPAVEQRRQHLQPADRRRDAVVPHDGRDQGRGRRDRRQPGVHVVLLQPDGLPALVHDVPGRGHQGAVPGQPDAAFRRPPADASRAQVRRDAGRQQRHPARRQHRADHRGDVPRHERHLRRLHRLRRARPPLRARARGVVRGARRRGPGDRHARSRRPTNRPARTSSSSCPTMARASARRSCSATARASASSCAA